MQILTIAQIVIALLIIVSVTFQTRGSESGIAFGGGGEGYKSKRGLEKFLFYFTVLLAVIFAAISILALLYRR